MTRSGPRDGRGTPATGAWRPVATDEGPPICGGVVAEGGFRPPGPPTSLGPAIHP